MNNNKYKIFNNGDFIMFREHHGVVVSTDKLIHPKNGDYYEHVVNCYGVEILCYNFSLIHDVNKIRLEKIKKLKSLILNN